MHRGADLLREDLDAAERCYRQAIDGDPSLRGAWFDLGLVHKWRHEWAESLACNQRAAALRVHRNADDAGDPAHWNAGIAATALHDWEAARTAWRGYGIRIDDGEGPIQQSFGMGVVRLQPDERGETVWGRRIDPARVVIESIPLTDSGFRSGDTVLHDGEPQGERSFGGTTYYVFNVLERWEASPHPTVEVIVETTVELANELIAQMRDAGLAAENWTTSVVAHCVACSYGRLDFDHPDHAHDAPTAGDGTVSVGCSGDPDQIRAEVTRWSTESGVRVLSVVADV
jgi:hypothetical protein